jgi:hypothetical protein
MELKLVRLEIPKETNLILGQAHFIKTVEDLYEVLVGIIPKAKFGLAFAESSGPCLVRAEGNDDELKGVAARNILNLGAGHSFLIFLRDAYPVNVLNAIKGVPEVCRIFCATANPVEVVLAETEQGRAILGVVDGSAPKGVESDSNIKERQEFLRKIGYKR